MRGLIAPVHRAAFLLSETLAVLCGERLTDSNIHSPERATPTEF